jgi:hypothetical protein
MNIGNFLDNQRDHQDLTMDSTELQMCQIINKHINSRWILWSKNMIIFLTFQLEFLLILILLLEVVVLF